MPGLGKISGKEMIAILSKLGFVVARQKGSHVVLKKNTEKGEIGCVVPLHDELKIGTIKGILKQARVSEEEFVDMA